MTSKGWSAADLPDLSDRTAIVTGANSGLGFETAKALAGAGTRVVMACRSTERAGEARRRIEAAHPGAALEVLALDLASLSSVRAFAAAALERCGALHVLCNNAGVMALPHRRTSDGFEMQLGTNHLGHFALTGLLLERLLATPGARVVTVSSTMHWIGRIDFDDLVGSLREPREHGERRYGRWSAYGQSKLANLLFTYELERRLEACGAGLIAVAAHPGYAATNLQLAGPRMAGSTLMERLSAFANRLFAQGAEMGALPILYAAAAPDVAGGDFYGPSSVGELWGPPRRVRSSARSHDRETAVRLWTVSEEATGVRYEALAKPAAPSPGGSG